MLYFGSYDKEGSCFKFTVGNKVYEFTNELRKSLFGITVVEADEEDESDPLVTDCHTHVNYDGNCHGN